MEIFGPQSYVRQDEPRDVEMSDAHNDPEDEIAEGGRKTREKREWRETRKTKGRRGMIEQEDDYIKSQCQYGTFATCPHPLRGVSFWTELFEMRSRQVFRPS